MQSARGGYTIIEVMVVLAVGLVTFFAAIALFAGKQGRTEFSQAMRDIDSKIQSVVNDVGVSQFPGASQYSCDTPSGVPVLTAVAAGVGTNEKCIFLGKALQIVGDTDPRELRIYTVLGSRLSRSGDPPTTYNFDNSTGVNPEAIMGQGNQDDLTETYLLPFGVSIVSVNSYRDPGTTSLTALVGFYNSLQSSGSTEQGGQSLVTLGYIDFPTNDVATLQLRQTINGNGPYTYQRIRSWTICFRSGTSSETARLAVNASFAGINTKLAFESCT
ncbi:MAG: type II secretion system protein [Candidatus Saccharimonadales bacterium]